MRIMKSGTPREGDALSHLLERSLLWFILLLSIALRISLYKIQSGDYSIFLQPWYDFIKAHGGFAALKENFSDYNLAYLYLLAGVTYLPIEPIIAIKAISIVFDLMMALFTYLILYLKYKHPSIPILGPVA